MSYLKDTARGVAWIGLFRILTRAISFGKTILLARILSPEQFGVFGVVALTLSLLEVFTETGVNTVLIQLKKNATEYINSAWVVSIVRGVVIAIGMVLGSQFVGVFFHIPESASLIALAAAIPFVRGFINPSVVNFQKELLFRKEFVFRTIIFSVDAFTSIGLTLLLKSPAGLVWGILMGAVFEMLLSHIFLNPKPKLEFKRENLSYVVHRGKWMTMSGIFDYLIQNGDNIVVGRLLGPGPLGLYQMAYQISTVPVTEISNILSKVAFPVFVKMGDDRRLLVKAYAQLVITIAAVVGMVSLTLIVLSPQFVQLILGEKWISIVPVLQILLLFAFVKSVVLSSYAFFLAIERQELLTLISLVGLFCMAISIVPLISTFGIVGAAYATLIGALFSMLPMGYYLYRERTI